MFRITDVSRPGNAYVPGIGASLCSALTLLWVYAWTTVSPGPDYYTRKIRFMFSIPDPGYATWLGIFGLILGFILICMGVIGQAMAANGGVADGDRAPGGRIGRAGGTGRGASGGRG
jgi:hypothetical protein